MNVFELFAKLSLDHSDYEKSLGDAEKDAREAGKEIDGTLGKAAKDSEKKVDGLGDAAKESGKKVGGLGEDAKETGKKTEGLGDQVDELAKKLGIRIPDAAKDAMNGMSGFSSGTVAAMGAAAGAIAALYAGAKALYDLTLESAAYADELLTRSAKTGLSTDLLQGLDYAAKFLDFEGLDQTLVKLTSTMAAASEGTKAQADAFAALGVSVTDANGNLRDNYDVFLEVIDALGAVGNETERNAIANDIFGKSYSDMLPLINAGSKELQGYIDKLKESGRMMSEDQVKALGKVDDAHQELTTTIEATKNMMAVEFAPTAKAVMDAFSAAVKKGGDALINSGMIRNLGLIVENITEIFKAGTSIFDVLPGWMSPLKLLSGTLGAIAQFCALIADTADVLIGLLTLDYDKFSTGLGLQKNSGKLSNWQRTYMAQSGTLEQYESFYNPSTATPADEWYGVIGNNASGTSYWRGGPTWVGEDGPELLDLPQGSRILSNRDSKRLAGNTTNNFSITVNGIEELDEIIRWYQGRRVEGRMA